MKACILVGGYGTRLRPLTFTKPKPLIPFCNVPMVLHQIVALIGAGVTEIIFLISDNSKMLRKECEVWKKTYNVQFSFCHEEEPLGTAGPLRLALKKGLLDAHSRDPFFVLNSDIICEYPLRDLLAAHHQSQGEGTILLTKVSNWSKYGVVKYDDNTGRVFDFIEKPQHFVGDRINAGIYVFDPIILTRIPDGKCSLEHTIFPHVAAAEGLYCMEHAGIWKDIGQPIDFLHAVPLFIAFLGRTNGGTTQLEFPLATASSAKCTLIGENIIDPSASIHPEAVIGPNVTIASDCVIGKGARIDHSVVLSGSNVHDFACVTGCIVGWNCSIGRWAHCMNGCVLGEDVHVGESRVVNGVRALPHKTIDRSIFEPEIIM
ncbi:mannose-1-phosphate guanylyltransferase [Perkinsela sp. CCAP 1560/4]|nr:mannose-1-phosphate guanylyltransferase [Perkinsela sp. CCAP 1560/4]|eukprot:KNH04807.1 mannose-1-phosphate guanylyltransferase [Perkinsela sp. CCAP 1560/4]